MMATSTGSAALIERAREKLKENKYALDQWNILIKEAQVCV
jgi:hypothetical protein